MHRIHDAVVPAIISWACRHYPTFRSRAPCQPKSSSFSPLVPSSGSSFVLFRLQTQVRYLDLRTKATPRLKRIPGFRFLRLDLESRGDYWIVSEGSEKRRQWQAMFVRSSLLEQLAAVEAGDVPNYRILQIETFSYYAVRCFLEKERSQLVAVMREAAYTL